MTNTGHSVMFYTGPWYDDGAEPDGGGSRGEDNFLSANIGGGSPSSPRTLVNITGGPLSYRYQFHEIHIHYGMRDDIGSEHTIDGYSFPAEVNHILPNLQTTLDTLKQIRKVYNLRFNARRRKIWLS